MIPKPAYGFIQKHNLNLTFVFKSLATDTCHHDCALTSSRSVHLKEIHHGNARIYILLYKAFHI